MFCLEGIVHLLFSFVSVLLQLLFGLLVNISVSLPTIVCGFFLNFKYVWVVFFSSEHRLLPFSIMSLSK